MDKGYLDLKEALRKDLWVRKQSPGSVGSPGSPLPVLPYLGLEGHEGHSQELRKWWVVPESQHPAVQHEVYRDRHGAIVWAQKSV